MSIKILIADDHALLRQGIKRVLNFEDDLEVVGEASEGQEALSRTLVLQPDVLLIDLNMPGLSGIEVTKQLVAARVKTRIIALTVHDSDRYVLEMLRNGALGYILKDVEPTMLIKAIHVVANGGTFVYPKLAERIFGGLSDGADVKAKAREMWRDGRGDRLTAREMDVLAFRKRKDGQKPSDEYLSQAERQRPHTGIDLCAEAQDRFAGIDGKAFP